jgi:DNA-binding CsgD family transcriptional regulator
MEAPRFTTIEKNILWMLVQGKNRMELAMGLSLSEQEVDDALAALKARTGARNLWDYARRCALDNKIGGY